IEAAGGTLEVGTGGTITRTSGVIRGPLRKDCLSGQPVADPEGGADTPSPSSPGTPFIYPVGNSAGFFPATITVDTGSTGGITVQVFEGVATASPVLDPAHTLPRFWRLATTA